jgi:hypothetical protein
VLPPSRIAAVTQNRAPSLLAGMFGGFVFPLLSESRNLHFVKLS